MSIPESEYLSPTWRDGLFSMTPRPHLFFTTQAVVESSLTHITLDDRVVLVTGGAGTICSAQTRALVRLGANACIIGRNVEKTEKAAKDIATARKGARVLGIGGCDVRSVSDSPWLVSRVSGGERG